MGKDTKNRVIRLTPVRQDEARKFWEMVFASVMGVNGEVGIASELADSSLEAWLDRWED